MTRAGALFLEHEPLVAASVIAAQAMPSESGFRQRDVRFFLELFANWLESTTGTSTVAVHNTQVQRFLDALAKAGLARRVGRAPPRYRLSPDGLLDLLRRLVHRAQPRRAAEFFLVFHILDTYGTRLRAMAEREAPYASTSVALDLDALLDPDALLARERTIVEKEIDRLRVRIDESQETSRLARSMMRERAPLDAIVEAVEERYPYELNSQRRLSELLAGMPSEWRKEELSSAAEKRAVGLWAPTRSLLLAYLEILDSLRRAREVR